VESLGPDAIGNVGGGRHNGVIENSFALKKELQQEGVRFVSETDTEVIAQLVRMLRTCGSLSLSLCVSLIGWRMISRGRLANTYKRESQLYKQSTRHLHGS